MTERKPPGMKTEDWVEAQIQEAQNKGGFDNLPGAGKPIPHLADPPDADWWVKDFIRREKIDADALLPPALLLRKEKERLPETVRKLRTERDVRDHVAELNKRIMDCLRDSTGPVIPVGRVDPDEVVRQWALDRPAPAPVPPEPVAEPVRKTSWWQRLFSWK
jgi:Domain of unknown function (DUF1992)